MLLGRSEYELVLKLKSEDLWQIPPSQEVKCMPEARGSVIE